MVKKLLALLTALLLLASAALAAEITVCDGTATFAKLPFRGAAGGTSYQKTGMFYEASDLIGMKAGDVIDSITYYLAQPATANTGATYEVYLENAADDSAIANTTLMIEPTHATLVYRGTLEPRSSTLTIPFNKSAFTYQGGNLIVRVQLCVLGSSDTPSEVNFLGKKLSVQNHVRYGGPSVGTDIPAFYINPFIPKMTLHYTTPAPETGDGTPIALLCAAAAISAAAVVAMNKRRVQA